MHRHIYWDDKYLEALPPDQKGFCAGNAGKLAVLWQTFWKMGVLLLQNLRFGDPKKEGVPK